MRRDELAGSESEPTPETRTASCPPLLTSVELPEGGSDWPLTLPLLERTRRLDLDAPVTILVGENGTGKSTLLEALAIATDVPAAGLHDDPARDPTLEPVLPLADGMRPSWTARSRRGLFLRAEDFFGYVREQNRRDDELRADAERLARENAHLPPLELARIQGPYRAPVEARARRYGGDLDGRSHGETFLAFLGARLGGRGLYLLDEPEAALSPLRQLAFLSLVREAVAAGGQFIIATHAPILMAAPGARLLEIRDGRAESTPWDELEHVRTLRAFLEAPEAYLRHL